MVKGDTYFPKSRTNQECLLFLPLFPHSNGGSGQRIKSITLNKRHPDWKRKKTAFICRNIILIVENVKDPTKRLLELNLNLESSRTQDQ